MPYSRSDPLPLQCFDSNLYTINDIVHESQCIAATKQKTRCKHNIRKDTLIAVASLRNELSATSDAGDLLRLARELVLARCCNSSHRGKLKGDAACLDEVARRYLEHLGKADLLVGVEKNVPTPVKTPSKPADSVIKYSTRSSESIISRMQAPANTRFKTGFVYAFTSTMYPGIVKIGSGSVRGERPAAWAKCMPGMKILIEEPFAYHRVIERLIHLQLHEQRRKVDRCWHHGITHFELFEISGEEAVELIQQWQQIVKRDTLYDDAGQLKPSWKRRVAGMRGSANAQDLLDVLETEDQAQRLRQIKSEAKDKIEQEYDAQKDVKLAERASLASQPVVKGLALDQTTCECRTRADIRVKVEDDCQTDRSSSLPSKFETKLLALERWAIAMQKLSDSMERMQKARTSLQSIASGVEGSLRLVPALAA